MSAYSDYKGGLISESQYKSYMERECADIYYDDAVIPFEPTCEECEFCKQGMAFSHDIVDLDGNDQDHGAKGRLVLKKALHRQGYIQLCIRDLEHIKEVNGFDKVCEDHGELFLPEGDL